MPITFATDMDWIFFIFQPTDDDGNIVDSEGNLISGIVNVSEEEVIDGTNDRATIIRAPDALSGYLWERLEDVLYNGVPVIRHGLIMGSKIRALSFASRYWYFDPEIVSPQNKYSVLIKQKGKGQVVIPVEKKNITPVDVLPLTDTKLFSTTLDLIPLEDVYTVWFILIQRDGTNRFVHWYDIDGNWIQTINLNDTLGVPIGDSSYSRFYFMDSKGEMNTLLLQMYVRDWRDYEDISLVCPVKIPIEIFTTETIVPDLTAVMIQNMADVYYLSLGGTQMYVPSGVYAKSDQQLYLKYLLGESPYCEVTETYLSGGTYHPPDYDLWEVSAKCPSSGNDKFILAVMLRERENIYTAFEFVEAYVGIWTITDLAGIRTWYQEGLVGGFLGDVSVKIPLTQLEHGALAQIICHNNKIYVFSDTGSFYPYLDTTVKVYDFTGILLDSKIIHPWHYLEKITLIHYLEGYAFCYRLRDDWEDFGSDYYSSMQFLDPDSLEVIKTVSLPQYAALAVNRPFSKYMLTQVNELRSIQPPVSRPLIYHEAYNQPVGYLGYSKICESIAQNHLNWCAANCRLTHEDANGDLVYVRARAQGIYVAGENLAYIPTSNSEQEIDECMEGWIDSPAHKYTMCQFEHVMMGYASVTLPSSCATLTLGAGLFNGSGYTTEETVINIPVSQRGKIKLYCQVFAGG